MDWHGLARGSLLAACHSVVSLSLPGSRWSPVRSPGRLVVDRVPRFVVVFAAVCRATVRELAA